ncbi:MAG: hypothetical protein QXD48_02790 [Candidatus Aenigmatarchaeota archaeon]
MKRREFIGLCAALITSSIDEFFNDKIIISAVGDITLGYHFPPKQMKSLDYSFEKVKKNIFIRK